MERALNIAFQKRQVEKLLRAVVAGQIAEDSGRSTRPHHRLAQPAAAEGGF